MDNFDNELIREHQLKEEFSKNKFSTVIRHMIEERQEVIWINWNSSTCPVSYRESESQYQRAMGRLDKLLCDNNYVRVRHTDNKESVYVRVGEQPLYGLGDFLLLSLPVRTYDNTYISYATTVEKGDVLYVLEWNLDSFDSVMDYIDETHLPELQNPDYVKLVG